MAPKRSQRRSAFVRESIAPTVGALAGADLHVRLDAGAEWLHTARVATRKLRCDLCVFSSWLDPRWVSEIDDGLKRLGTLLGAVRDIDVLSERLGALALRLPERDWTASGSIATHLRNARSMAVAELQRELSAAWYPSLLRVLIVAAGDGAPLAVPNRRQGSKALITEAMDPAWKALKKAVRRVRSDTDIEGLHRIRIRAKRARYTAEAMEPFVSQKHRGMYARFIHRISQLQEYLGELHDIYLDRQALHAIPGVDPVVVDEIIELETAVAADTRHAWRTTWAKISRRNIHFWR